MHCSDLGFLDVESRQGSFLANIVETAILQALGLGLHRRCRLLRSNERTF